MKRLKRGSNGDLFFGACIAVALTACQAIDNHRETTSLRASIDKFTSKPMQMVIPGFMQPGGVVSQKPKLLNIGEPIQLNFLFSNGGGSPVYGAKEASLIWIVRTNAEDEATIVSQFKTKIEPKLTEKYEGSLVAAGGRIYHTIETDRPLTADDISDIISGRLSVFMLSHVWWNEKPEGFTTCYRLQPPENTSVTFEQTSWHVCKF